MNEKNLIKKQLIKNMIATFVTFTIIFAAFSAIIYNQVKNTMYQSIDRELILSVSNKDIEIPENGKIMKDNFGPKEKFSPRIIRIMRNESGKITNETSIGQAFLENFEDIPFDESKLNTIYTIVINNEYTYRVVTVKKADNTYLQLLANVDAEEQVLSHFGAILAFSATIAVFISIIASYFLSKKTIKPIIESYKKQTEFVQNASHELRTPLTIVQAKLELLLQKPESKIIDNTEEIRISLNETKRLTKLIKDLMLLARADSKNYNLDKKEMNIDGIVRDVSVPYKEFAELEEKKIILELNYGKNLNIDMSKISQLMIILLDNALKYTEKGDTIEVKTYEKDSKCVIEVKDSGIGIDDESIKHIFDRFYRADKARSRETGGTGLGLSIASWIVSVHDGTIKASHNQPKGTVFTIRL